MAGDTIYRQWLMLRAIPRPPGKSTPDIVRYLRDEGYNVTKRTVERDLDKLSALFGLTCDTVGRTNYWYFPQESKLLDLPGMETGAALAMLLAERQAATLLPLAALTRLKPYLARAREVIQDAVPPRLKHWTERFKIIHRGPVLAPQRLNPSVQDCVYEAVLQGRQVRVRYRAREQSEAREFVLHPYVVVLRDGVVYVVASAWDYTDLRHYALHRISSAELLPELVRTSPMTDVNEYVDRQFRYPVHEQPLRLKLRFDHGVGQHLIERPLADDQTAESDENGLIISATVADGEELRWWVLGFGERVEVLKPARLRREIAERIRAMAARYQTDATASVA